MKDLVSYKELLENSKAAMVAAMEIYNKPAFRYRGECAVILLINAWELALKAVISKQGRSIFHKNKNNVPEKALSFKQSFNLAKKFSDNQLSIAVWGNLEILYKYRNNAIHFYNEKKFDTIANGLAQAAIFNYLDLIKSVFGIDFAKELNWMVMPIGTHAPMDVIAYISGKCGIRKEDASNDVVTQLFLDIKQHAHEAESQGLDLHRLITIHNVKLESVRNALNADVVVGIDEEREDAKVVTRKQDPNVSHPFRQKEILAKVKSLHGVKFTSHLFQAILWRYDIKKKSVYCWQAKHGGGLTCYSTDLVGFIKRLSASDLEGARIEYAKHIRLRKD